MEGIGEYHENGDGRGTLEQVVATQPHEVDRIVEHLDATTAAFRVGYESPSQFSREYGRLFGAPPLRDITSLRQLAAV